MQIFNKLIHGGDYNPDQWLNHPEIIKEDIRLMKEAHINCVSLGIFAWSKLEPSEGVYDFKWLHEIIDELYANGIYAILATPSAAIPFYIVRKYPEVLITNELGIRRLPGERHNFCHTSKIMRDKISSLDEKLSLEFGKHPGVIAWHISNEFGGDDDNGECHCEECQRAFREFLKERYQSLDKLNEAWWTAFWSHTITNWDEIHSPSSIGEHELHGLKLDWKRFVSNQKLDFAKTEIAAIRKYSDKPVTTNMMTFFKPLDYFRWGEAFDFVSWDSYPNWHLEKDELSVASRNACFHSLIRSIKKAPFLLMESTPSLVNWKDVNTLKRPHMHELSSLNAIANGSNSVQYFQWRKARGSSEKFHGAVIDHKYGNNTRVFNDVKMVGKRLDKISDLVLNTINKPEIALIFDWENRWAFEDIQGLNRNSIDYDALINNYYKPLFMMGLEADVIDMSYDLSDYKVVIAPYNYMYKECYPQKVRDFISNGGIYVTTCASGEVNETDLCFLDHHPLNDVLGINPLEIDTVKEDLWPNTITYNNHDYIVKAYRAIIETTTASVLATYNEDFYKGTPALTVNHYGQGLSYFIASENDESFLLDFYKDILKDIDNGLKATYEKGIVINCRYGENYRLYFIQNFNRHPSKITLHDNYLNIETDEMVNGPITLDTFEVMILKAK